MVNRIEADIHANYDPICALKLIRVDANLVSELGQRSTLCKIIRQQKTFLSLPSTDHIISIESNNTIHDVIKYV